MKRFLLALLLLAGPAFAQTKFSLFDQVGATGRGRTPAKGQLFYSSNTSGQIESLAIGSTGYCLVVDGTGVPVWSNICTGVVSSVGLAAPAQFTVTGSPVTSSGTLTLGWQSVSQNYLLAGPTSGAGAPSFRALAAGDIGITTKGDLMTYSTVLTRLGVGTDGYVLTADSTQTTGLKWGAAASGTVTSVGLSLPSFITVSGSPVTTTGTLTGTLATQTANTIFAGPTTGAAAAPTFRALVPDDVPVMTATVKGLVPTPPNDATKYLLGDGTWGTTGGGGTVTSVGLSVTGGGTALYSVSGSPVTGSGTLSLNVAAVNAHQFYKGNNSNQWTIDYLDPTDYPLATASARGALLTLDNNTAHFLRGDGTWQTPAGAGTVTSVGLSLTSLGWLSVSGSPVTTSGTLGISTVGGQTANNFLATPNGSTGSVALRTIAKEDLATAGFTGSGVGHSGGSVPDPGAVTGATKFLREDASWSLPPQGTVTSVSLTGPTEMTVGGTPITSTGTISLGWASESANTIFAGPTTGSPNTPTFRALVPADYPVFVASGASHAAGAVPDPGVTSGTTKFLREDATWVVPTFSSSIEVKESDGTPDVTGVSILAFDQATGFTVTNNGGGQVTVACTSCGGGGGTTAFRQDQFTGDGSTTIFTTGAAPATNGIAYVALNGLPQIKTTSWTVSGSNVTMAAAPITGASLTIGYYTALPGTVTHTQEDFTGAASTDFTLAHTPATNGILLVSLRGLIQPQTTWSIVSSTTLRFTTAVPTGDAVTISYNY